MGAFGISAAPFVATLFVAVVGATHLGCQSMDISSDWDRSVDFSKLSSYDWIPEAETSGAGTENTLTRDRVHRAVDRILSERGYVHQPSGTPDFLVGYLGAIQSKLDVRTIDDYYGYRPGWSGGGYGAGARTYAREYDWGTLILDISDPHTSKLMWRGSARTEVTRAETPEEREIIINEAVGLILERFPPQSSQSLD